MIIKDLFSNLTILVSLLFFYAQVTKNYHMNNNSSVKVKIIAGILGGIVCNILMHYSLQIESTIMDLRHVPTILLAYYGGPIPALISMILTIIGRFFISMNLASYLAIVISVSGTLFAIYFSKSRYSKVIKIASITTFNNLIFSIIFCFLVHDTLLIVKAIPLYWVISYFSTYLAFFVLGYIRQSQRLFNKYQEESRTDALTGLNNIRKFDEVYNQLISNLNTDKMKLSVLYIDIDFFKGVNDTYGHSEGDLVLKELGYILIKNTRPFDIVSRNGGEEFTVLLVDCQVNEAAVIAENIRKNVEDIPFKLSTGKELKLTISIGVASYGDTTKEPKMLIKDADKALYEAKHTGRNKVCVASL